VNTPEAPLVVVYDPITTIRWDYDHERAELAARGVRFELADQPARLDDLLPAADVVVVSSRLRDDHLELMTNCCGIQCYSVGMDGVNVALAERMGITVSNTPGYCTEEVSDHGIALLMALQRALLPMASAAARGQWQVRDRDDFYTIRRISGTTLGVIGVGRIGRRVAEKARGLGMATIGYDPYAVQQDLPDVELVAIDQLLRRSDAVMLCAALTTGSKNLIGAAELELMKPDAVLVNVARGGLVDERALADALRDKRIRSAALDVRSPEPPDPENDPLLGLDNVVLTQHVAATSIEAFRDIHHLAVGHILAMLEAGGRLAPQAGSAGR
jgi:phosphoglycerate dehydrogenase-like enzyme